MRQPARAVSVEEALEIASRHLECGRPDRAARVSQSVLQHRPYDVSALYIAGMAARSLGRLGEAVSYLNAAAVAAAGGPFHARALNALGVTLGECGRLDDAAATFARAVSAAPHDRDAYHNLGVTLAKAGRLAEAITAYTQGLAASPDDAETYEDLIAALHEYGDVSAAITWRRAVVARWPHNAAAHSDLLVSLLYDGDVQPEDILAEHLAWTARHAAVPTGTRAFEHHDRIACGRALRVGYVSEDFREHPVGRFIAPLFEHHDRPAVVAVGYSGTRAPDGLTRRLSAAAAEWREVGELTNEAMIALIRRDRIDILVDLGGHMSPRRLPVFAARPAPVQVAYLNYPNTTGLSTIDYRLTDDIIDPPGLTDVWYTERLVRLPDCAWCFDATAAAPPVGPPPVARNGHLTFGCLNRLTKVTPQMLEAWRQVMDAVPGSRLLLGTSGRAEAAVREWLLRSGIDPHRVSLVAPRPLLDYLGIYGLIDIALDTYPHNGHTTTCDAVWMGVPVVTVRGATTVSRLSASVLANVGLHEFITNSLDGYVRTAIAYARPPEQLAILRAELRNRMRNSAACDAPRLAREVERAYRSMWAASGVDDMPRA